MIEPLLTVADLTAGYGRLQVLHGVSLSLHAGEMAAIVGANGAGKSTLLRVLGGLLRPWQGRITFAGRDVTHLEAEDRVRLGLVLVPERRQLFSTMTVAENLNLGAYARGRQATAGRKADLERVFALFPVLKERLRQQAGTLSGGEQQMLAVGRALMAAPKLLLLDEPTLGLAPRAARQILDAASFLAQSGTAVLLVEQQAHLALAASHQAYVMEAGSFPLAGPAADLARDPRVRSIYLGIS